MKAVYVAWFEDERFDKGDEDRDQNPMLLIEADSVAEVIEWGDHLARLEVERDSRLTFVKSYCYPLDHPVVTRGAECLVEVRYGQEPESWR